jgi:membrane protease YdiL (CAAX protease family)
MSIRRFAIQYPVLAAFSCAVSQFVVTILILKAGLAFAPPAAFGKVKLVAFASTVILPLLLVQVFGLWRRAGFELRKPAPIFFVSLLFCALFLSMGVHPQEHGNIRSESLMQLVNAFGEELLFRGVIFAILLSLPKWKAVTINGILFGCMHLIHAFMDKSWGAALSQSAVTSLAGMMLTAVRYATGSLWLTMVLHMFQNLSIIYSNVEAAAGPAARLLVQRLAYVFEFSVAAYVVWKMGRKPETSQVPPIEHPAVNRRVAGLSPDNSAGDSNPARGASLRSASPSFGQASEPPTPAKDVPPKLRRSEADLLRFRELQTPFAAGKK